MKFFFPAARHFCRKKAGGSGLQFESTPGLYWFLVSSKFLIILQNAKLQLDFGPPLRRVKFLFQEWPFYDMIIA